MPGPINLTFRDLQKVKQAEATAAPKGIETQKSGHQSNKSSGGSGGGVTTSKTYTGAVVKIAIGKANIKISDQTSADELGRQLNVAFGTLADNLDWYVKQLEGYLPQDLELALGPTFALSQEYCPVDTGELLASGYLATETFRGGARAEIGYAKGGTPEYAVYVHEIPYEHQFPTSYKFLQRAIDEDYFNIIQRVTSNIKTRSGAF